MRFTPKAAGLTMALIATLALAGCAQAPVQVIPTAAPSVKPVFKSDAAALAAAKKAYTGYLAASDAVAHDGGVNTERLAQWETPTLYKQDQSTLTRMHSAGRHTTGSSIYRDVRLQASTVSANGKAKVSAYVCLDISHTALLDSSGKNVGVERPLVLPLVITLVSSTGHSTFLLVDRSVTWSGNDFCA